MNHPCMNSDKPTITLADVVFHVCLFGLFYII